MDPYRDLDLTITAGATGWDVTVARPAGLLLVTKTLWWRADDCAFFLTFRQGATELVYELDHTFQGASVRAHSSVDGDPDACIPYAWQRDVAFTPDDGRLPPIEPERAALAGSYDLTVSWPAVTCMPQPATHRAFSIAIDRTDSDHPVATAVAGWPIAKTEYDAGALNVFSRTETRDHDVVTELLRLRVDGRRVTGEAALDLAPPGGAGAKRCKPVWGTVRGTIER